MKFKLQRKFNNGTIKKENKKKLKGKRIKIFISGVLILVTVFSASIYNSNKERQDNIKAISNVYCNIVEPYDKIIKDIKNILIARNITSPMDIFSIYNKLLWEGYFSIGGEYSYDNENLKDVPFNEGADIITGNGVCRQNAQMLSKLFNEFGYNSFPVNVYVDEKLNVDKQKNVCRNIGNYEEKNDGFSAVLSETYGNHQVVLLVDKNDINFFDPTNLCVYKLDDNNELTVINGEGKVKFLPTSDFYLNGVDLNMLSTIIKIKLRNNKDFLSEDEINTSFDNMDSLYEKNKKYFEDFHNNEKATMNELNDALKKY